MSTNQMARMQAARQAKSRAMMPEVMAVNGQSDRSTAPNFRGKPPQPANVARYAKGGKVKHDDAKQDKSLIAKMINAAMPRNKVGRAKPVKKAMGGPIIAPNAAVGPPQATPMKKGGKACAPVKLAAGGAAKLRKGVMTKDGAPKKQPRKGMGSVF